MPDLKKQWWQIVDGMTFSNPLPLKQCFAACALKALDVIEKHAHTAELDTS